MDKKCMVIKDTIPERYLGVRLFNRFGFGYGFTFDEVDKTQLYFQPQAILHICKDEDQSVLFEFRVLCNCKFSKRIDDNGFYEDAYQLILSTIEEFNRHIKLKNSMLTVHKTYTPIPTIEQTKTLIRQAYMRLDFQDFRTTNN